MVYIILHRYRAGPPFYLWDIYFPTVLGSRIGLPLFHWSHSLAHKTDKVTAYQRNTEIQQHLALDIIYPWRRKVVGQEKINSGI